MQPWINSQKDTMEDDNGRAKMTSLFFQEKNGSLHKAVTEIPLAQYQT